MQINRKAWKRRHYLTPWAAATALAGWSAACTGDRQTISEAPTSKLTDLAPAAPLESRPPHQDLDHPTDPAEAAAARCSGLEDCDNGSSCFRLTGVRWCQISSNGNTHWTPVNVFNHTGLGSVNDAFQLWNFPPSGPSNTLLLATDGLDNFNHDIDVFTVSVTDWWWGWSFYDTSGSCLVRKSGGIKLNTFRMPNTGDAHILTEQHELGHEIGLGHVCACPQVMDPCFNCGASSLTDCDAQGAAALYH